MASRVLFDDLRDSWLRSLRARNTSPKTQGIYAHAAQQFSWYMAGAHPKVSVDRVAREHVEDAYAAAREIASWPPERHITNRVLQEARDRWQARRRQQVAEDDRAKGHNTDARGDRRPSG